MPTDTTTAAHRLLRWLPLLTREALLDHPRADASEVTRLRRRFGHNSASFVVEYPAPWRRFLATDVEGAACYLEARRTAVVWGDPLCRERDTAAVLDELTAAMRRGRRRICLVPIGPSTATAALERGYGVLKIGEEPVFDLREWRPPRGRAGKTLRGQLNRARRSHTEVGAYDPAKGRQPALEEELSSVQRSWGDALGDRVVNSVLEPAPLLRCEEKRYFYARRGGRVEAFVACTPIAARRGWLLEDLTRRPDAGRGVSELVAVEALQTLRAGGAGVASLGLAPGRGLEEQPDRRMAAVAPLLRFVLASLERHYRFTGIEAWAEKFRPSAWEPRFVAFRPRWPTHGLVRGAMQALGLARAF